jgi:hypothetical protein
MLEREQKGHHRKVAAFNVFSGNLISGDPISR